MKTVIMAGGRETRISEMLPEIPKMLIPIKSRDEIERSVLEWEIESLASQGFTDIILTVSQMHEKIEGHFGDGSRLVASIEYFVEVQPLGNAGALFMLRDHLIEPFLLLNADAVFDIDFNWFMEFHRNHGGLVTLFYTSEQSCL